MFWGDMIRSETRNDLIFNFPDKGFKKYSPKLEFI